MGIRVVPNEPVPAAVYPLLLPHERRVITVRYHLATLIGPAALATGCLAGALILGPTGASRDAKNLAWAAFGTLFVYLIKRVFDWFTSFYVVTAYRMLTVKGAFTRDVGMLPITLATTLKFRRTTLGRFFGYGTFIIEGVGQARELRTIRFLPYPEQLYLEVCGLIFQEVRQNTAEGARQPGDAAL